MDTYQIVTVSLGFSQKKAFAELSRLVNEQAVRGWKPLGGVSVAGTILAQAMRKDK